MPVSGANVASPETQDVTSITLALKTLGTFDFEGKWPSNPLFGHLVLT